MARSTNGTTQWLFGSPSPISTIPATVACWFLSQDDSANQSLLNLYDTGAGGHYFGVGINGGTVYSFVNDGGGNISTTCSAGYNTGVWNHACAVAASATSRKTYTNGGSAGTSSASAAANSLDQVNVAVFASAGGSAAYHGIIAECAVWNVALTDAEVAALVARVPAFRVQPAALKGYWPLWGLASPEPDLSTGGLALTLTGSPAAANHAPVTLFTRKAPSQPAPVVVVATTKARRTLYGRAGSRSVA